MFGLMVSIELIVSILLIIVILMQSSKGGGLAGSFGGGSMGTVFGVRRTADFLSQATTILASVFIGLCLVTNIFFLPGSKDTRESVIQRGINPTSVPRPSPPRATPAPAQPSAGQPPAGQQQAGQQQAPKQQSTQQPAAQPPNQK
jgi:preprotein translocase subunit SecG